MKQGYALDFLPPLNGFDGDFNTIRLGVKWSKQLSTGDMVYLQDSKSKMIFGKAEVTCIESDSFGQICLYHAKYNHSEVNRTDDNSAYRIYQLMKKMLGPHIVSHKKKAVAIYLRRIE